MILALKNELAIDHFDMVNLFRTRKYSIPVLRPLHVMKRIKSNTLLSLSLYGLVIFWPVIYIIVMGYKILKYKRLIHKNTGMTLDKSIVIATSHRIQDLYHNGIEGEKPTQWLTVPWVKIDKIDFINQCTRIDLMSLVGLKDLFRVFSYSLKGCFIWFKEINHPIEILQSYVLFEYFMMQIVLNKLNGNGVKHCWYSNHYDRWSVLIDSSNFKSNVLIQHGVVNKNLFLPYKLKNVLTLYAINELNIDIFKKNIILWNKTATAKLLNSTIKLKNIEYNNSIFIISRPVQFEFDVELIDKLLTQLPEIVIYIKPHPLFDFKPYRDAFNSKSGCILIEDKDFYPDTSTVVSGYSTLAVEYEAIGKCIIWIPEETIDSIIAKVGEALYRGITE